MQEDDNRAGVRVDNGFKKGMAMTLNSKLLDESIYVHQKFVCISEENDDDAPPMLKEIVDQLINYSRILKPSNDIHKAPTERYSGKSGHGKRAGLNGDGRTHFISIH